MLQITPLGHACFEIKSDELTIVTDPFDEKTGELPSDLKADIVTISHDHFDHGTVHRVSGDPKAFDWPGEYEVSGIQIRGYASYHDTNFGADRGENVIFVFRFPDATIAHMGDLGHDLDSDTIDKMGHIDILLIPVGGTYTIDAKAAKKIIDTIEPRIVVPMHFADDKIKIDNLNSVDEFLKLMGRTDLETENVLKIKKSDLPVDAMEIKLLKNN